MAVVSEVASEAAMAAVLEVASAAAGRVRRRWLWRERGWRQLCALDRHWRRSAYWCRGNSRQPLCRQRFPARRFPARRFSPRRFPPRAKVLCRRILWDRATTTITTTIRITWPTTPTTTTAAVTSCSGGYIPGTAGASTRFRSAGEPADFGLPDAFRSGEVGGSRKERVESSGLGVLHRGRFYDAVSWYAACLLPLQSGCS